MSPMNCFGYRVFVCVCVCVFVCVCVCVCVCERERERERCERFSLWIDEISLFLVILLIDT
jgi:hypothetical protein